MVSLSPVSLGKFKFPKKIAAGSLTSVQGPAALTMPNPE